ncbi:hypothetical protein L9F63_027096, partial [Diploptera punctata]
NVEYGLLVTQDCYILDTVSAGIFVWIGKHCTKEEKVEAMKRAEKFLTSNNYPVWTKVNRIVEGGEPSTFKQYFSGWREAEDQIGLGRVFTLEQIAASMPETDFDPSTLHAGKIRALCKKCRKSIWFMPDNGSENYIIYFWQGRDTVQVRVTQGNEPRHFLRIFKGKMIVFLGGKASGFRNLKDHDTYDVDGTRLFQVRGTCADDVRAVQVPEVSASLSSDDVFVLETPGATYVWIGKGASDEEKEMAEKAVGLVSPDCEPVTVLEGEEPAHFWDALGGQGDYKKGFDGQTTPLLLPRLFHCHVSPVGKLRVEEITHFRQELIILDDIMIAGTGMIDYLIFRYEGPAGRWRLHGIKYGTKWSETFPPKSRPTARAKDHLNNSELNAIVTLGLNGRARI